MMGNWWWPDPWRLLAPDKLWHSSERILAHDKLRHNSERFFATIQVVTLTFNVFRQTWQVKEWMIRCIADLVPASCPGTVRGDGLRGVRRLAGRCGQWEQAQVTPSLRTPAARQTHWSGNITEKPCLWFLDLGNCWIRCQGTYIIIFITSCCIP